MKAFTALLVDAYRELNSRKLFWVVLSLSFIFILVYASIGFDDKGVFMFFGLQHTESELIRAGTPMAGLLYRGIFATFVVPIWLAWIATILALISTAPIFPEFVAGGSIDLVLCKPISRLRVFLYKYLASLLFVVLQVTVFCAGIFLAMGWRLNDWDWRVFLAIPLVTLVYSYLYSFCVFVGVWTRSTLAALLLTMLLWFGIYAVNATEGIVVMVRSQMEAHVEQFDEELALMRGRNGDVSTDSGQWKMVEDQRNKEQAAIDKINRWVKLIRAARYPMPKTGETIQLLDRTLARVDDINLMDLITGKVMVGADGKPRKRRAMEMGERAQEKTMQEAERSSPLFILSTSLGFECLMLAGAALVFCRRDY